jgi:uncharacterized protein (DUF1697 family)
MVDDGRMAVFLRAVNVGGNRLVPMAGLRALLEGLGYEGVSTYLQSGNAMLSSSAPPAVVVAEVTAALRERFGFEVPVLARAADQLEKTLSRKHSECTDDSLALVLLLAEAVPDPPFGAREHLPERWWAYGDEIHLWCPGGVHASKVAQALTRAKIIGTARNRRTLGEVHRRLTC